MIGDKIWFGGGSAGVLCTSSAAKVDDTKTTMAPRPDHRQVDAQWKKLQAAYEDDEEEPRLYPAVGRSASVRPADARLAGREEEWHVDAPVAVAGGKVLVVGVPR